MNKVKLGFFSFTEITDPYQHRAYNEWHQLDHMPEQYPLPGLAFGQRWVCTPELRAARLVGEAPLDAAHYVTVYLMTDPVEQTLTDFMELGAKLHQLGRFFQPRISHLSGPFQFLEAHAAPRVLVSAESIPYRPNRGAFVIVEEPTDEGRLDGFVRELHETHMPALLDVSGVAGAYSFASSPSFGNKGWSKGHRRITVCYLDDDQLTVTAGIAPLLEARWDGAPVRPLLAGPYASVIPWQWNWFDDEAT